MQWNQGIFAVKLYELEEEYGRLQSKLHVFQEKDGKQAEEALDRLLDEYREQELLLKERVQASRSPAVASLAQAQFQYGQRVEQILKQELPQEMEDQAEAMSLYAEYAIDFATQTMRHALIAALTAVILQRRAETNPNENGEKGESL